MEPMSRDSTPVRGILFDSGGTLVGPAGGRWNPRFDFEEVLLWHHPDVPRSKFSEAFIAGDVWLSASASPTSRDDYHRVMLAVLDVDAPSTALLAELDAPTELPVLEPFPETVAVLRALAAREVPMCLVTDNWRGIERLYEQLELARFFKGFVVSEVLGCRKPDPRMYAAGADALGLRADECLFVDDDPDLVGAALDLGYQGATIVRGREPVSIDTPVIESLWA
jgi:putative hydrolase of the HAD superfamily